MIDPDGKPHECERCGECCTHGGPFLNLSDLKLFEKGVLRPGDVYILRKDELEYDVVTEEVQHIPEEMMRIKERPGTKICRFYDIDTSECTIYDSRPLHCTSYECWFPKKLFITMSKDQRLNRSALFKKVPSILEIIEEHEKACSYEKIEKLAEATQNGSEEAANELLEALRFDTQIRTIIAEKLNMNEEDLESILGRSLMLTIRMYGYQVNKEEDGTYCLTVREAPGSGLNN